MKDAVKSEWQVRPLGEVVTLNYGKALARSERDPNGSVPVYGANGVMDWSEHTLTEGPSLVIGRKGSAGEVTRVDGPFWPSDVTYYTTHDHNALDFNFLHYTLRTLNLPSMARGVKPGINRNDVYALPIPLPPLEEQQRIVAVLDEAFEGLARARAHAEANLQNAQELFENILTHTLRHKFELGAQKLLGDVCDLAQGLAINKGTKHLLVEKSSKPLLRIKDLRNKTVEQYVAETGFPPKAAVTADDIIYTRTGQIGLVFRGFEGVLHNNCFSVRTLGDVSQEYLFWWLQEPVFKGEIISLASRAAQPDITHKLFKARSITFPNKDDQASAVELIEVAFSETKELQEGYRNKIQGIDDLRQSLLQKAFAGELT